MTQIDDVKKLVNNHYRYLQTLKEKQALMGIDTPAHILIEIENTEEKIRGLENEFRQLESDTPPKAPDKVDCTPQNIMNPLRECMEQMFMDEGELRQFCQDHFKYVFRRLKNTDGWDHIIGQIILYCETRGELDNLWELLHLKSPSVYQQYAKYRI